jgi:hypothetical protein
MLANSCLILSPFDISRMGDIYKLVRVIGRIHFDGFSYMQRTIQASSRSSKRSARQLMRLSLIFSLLLVQALPERALISWLGLQSQLIDSRLTLSIGFGQVRERGTSKLSSQPEIKCLKCSVCFYVIESQACILRRSKMFRFAYHYFRHAYPLTSAVSAASLLTSVTNMYELVRAFARC